MLIELGIDGVQVEDNVQLSDKDTKAMFIDILPELPPDEGIGYVSFYMMRMMSRMNCLAM